MVDSMVPPPPTHTHTRQGQMKIASGARTLHRRMHSSSFLFPVGYRVEKDGSMVTSTSYSSRGPEFGAGGGGRLGRWI